MFDDVCSGQMPKINVGNYVTQLNKFGNVLAAQIQDLRSMSAKQASMAIQVLA
jgi:hypothetical protein